ncbi:MAG: restriction endonuclease subunit S [Desulfobacteraceae bacterium]|nr:restriction endonuclease subunit S [Desulfobacteraceae bacterium]
MKDSGVEWLGKVPEHWEVKRLRHIIEGTLVNGLFKKKEYFGSGVILINVFDIYRDNFLVDTDSLERVEANKTEIEKYAVKSGDIFFVRSSLKLEGVGKSVCILDVAEPTVFECHVVRARPDTDKILPVFLINYLNSTITMDRLISLANMVTMTTLDQIKIKDIEVAVPPILEQVAIAKYLKREYLKTDALVSKVTEAIEKLKEYRTALISTAVTGKIDIREEGGKQ